MEKEEDQRFGVEGEGCESLKQDEMRHLRNVRLECVCRSKIAEENKII